MNKELRSCPFCGGEAQVNERYRGGTPNRKMYWVSCKQCGIAQLHNDLAGYRYQGKAIDKWNRREPLEDIVEQLEELKDKADNYQVKSFSSDEKNYYTGMERGLIKAIEIVKGGAE